MRNRVEAFTGADAERRAERAGHWIKAVAGIEASQRYCVAHDMPALTKATGESVNQVGGFLVPPELDEAIIAVRDTVGAFRNAEVRPTRSDNLVRPRRTGGLTANFVAEGAAIPESSIQFDAVEAALKKLGILTRASSELMEDSEAALAEFFAVEAGYAFASTEDDCGFNGDGTSTFSGITGLGNKITGKSSIAAASGHNTYLTIDATDLANLMSGVLSVAVPGARWYVSAIGYAQTFARLAATSGALNTTVKADGTIAAASYLGFPVAFSAKLPNATTSLAGKPMMYFGNLKLSSVIVEKKDDPTIFAASWDRYLDQDQVALRATRRIDIINHTVGDTSNYGAIAVLVGTT